MLHPKRYPFSWGLGWSYSRMGAFRNCLRQYYYRYYGKRFLSGDDLLLWGELGELSTVPLVMGSVVHLTVKEVLEGFQHDRVMAVEEAVAFGQEKFLALLESMLLLEDRYGDGVSGSEVERRLGLVRLCVESFFESWWPSMLLDAGVWDRRRWVVDPPGFGEFRFCGKKVYAKPDLLFKYERGGWFVVDWKTGVPDREESRSQIESYIFFTKDVYDLPMREITGVVEYLMQPDEEPLVIHGKDLDPTGLWERISTETAEMESMLVDAEKNVPKPMDCFEKNPGRRRCGWCSFRGLCKPEMPL